MKKSLIRTIAVSLIAASFFSVTTVKSPEANEFGMIGKKGRYNQSMAILRYVKTLRDKSYDQMPDSVKINTHWCAALTKHLLGETSDDFNSVSLTKNYFEDRGRYHYRDDYHPQIGDLILYEESVPGIKDGPDHIGVVVDVKTVNGEDYPSTIEGNYFDIPWTDDKLKTITAEQYRDFSNSDEYKFDTRRVGYVPSNRVRRHMIEGYIEVDRTMTEYTYGDVNADGMINSMDALMILHSVLQKDIDGGVLKESRAGNLSVPEYYYRMDVNGDGKVTQPDATLLIRYLAR